MDTDTITAEEIELILSALYFYTKYSFQGYKKGTLIRRIKRRMDIRRIEHSIEYTKLVQEDVHEANALCKDLLISVTAFFRDSESYKVLQSEAIRKIVHEKAPGKPIRIWIPACASGEEVYSIGMLFIEQLELANKKCSLHIFATDIDKRALEIARSGTYPSTTVANVTQERLDRFFIKEGKNFKIRKSLRECVVFAVQNLVSDPPFSRLDLISCRNLLIYLEPTLQRKIIDLIYFGLNQNGYLFLGSSETIATKEKFFSLVNKKARLYQRIGSTRRSEFFCDFVPGQTQSTKPGAHTIRKMAEPTSLGKLAQKILLDRHSPFAVLVNQQYEVLYIHGQSGLYLEQTTGEPSLSLLAIARVGLRSQLRNILQTTFEHHQESTIRVHLKRDDIYCPVILTTIPVELSNTAERLAVVTFAENMAIDAIRIPTEAMIGLSEVTLINQLEAELEETKDCLRRSVEELEASNEELRTSNEEIVSGNEELQSTNEELEASKEELQSLNEELSTLNMQLRNKVKELAVTNNDLSNLMSNTDIAALFLDSELRIGRFTPATTRLFSLIFADMGRYVGDIANRFIEFNLIEEAELVLDNQVPVEKYVSTDTCEYLVMRIRPFRTEEDKIEGVVVTFVDITYLKLAEESLMRPPSLSQQM